MTVGGAEVLADRLARKLSGRFETVFACLDDIGELGEQLRSDGFQIECLGRSSGVDVRCAWRLAKFLQKQRVDLVVAHQYTPFFYSMTARMLGRNRPIVFVEHGRALPDYPRPKRMMFNRWMVRGYDRLIAVGADVRRALIENEGLPAERVEVIYNGVDLNPFQPNDSQRLVVRRELGLDSAAFVIAQVARLDVLKDHLTAVRTMKFVVDTNPEAMLVMIGEGPERTAIEAEIETLGLQKNVRLLGLRKDIPQLLSATDAMLLTSVSEGIPLTLIEGMAAELPIVTTDVGGIREVVSENETALLAPAGESRLLAKHLQQLSGNVVLRKQLGEAGSRLAHEKFSEEAMHAHYTRVYDEVLGHSAAHAGPEKAYVRL